MSRRSVASLVAGALLVVLLVVAAQLPTPYVTLSPSDTIDVLGRNGDKEIIEIDGRRTFPTDGELRLTTITVTNPENELSLVQALAGWLRPDVAVMPVESIYPEQVTAEEDRAESAAQMVNSQDTAVAVALTELGYELDTYAEVTGVSPGGPSEDKLEARDRILAIGKTKVRSVEDVFLAVGEAQPGDTVPVRVRRGDAVRTLEVRTTAAEDDPKRALLGILVGQGYVFPFDVRVGISERIGGPSAGLMFALSIFDVLTPGALTGGEVVAGTGTIAADGSVGPIGGIQQKIAGAEDDGAALFLVPPDNCDAAVLADTDGIRLVRADTMHSAVESIEAYADDPAADLPRCPE